MGSFVLLPLIFLKFWYFEAPRGMFSYFASLNHAFLELFSLPLFLRTFFQPLKNEYRQGLVWFSRFVGMTIKSVMIFVDLLIFIILLAIELTILIGFLIFPIATVYLLIYGY
jgi:hypothetical protein